MQSSVSFSYAHLTFLYALTNPEYDRHFISNTMSIPICRAHLPHLLRAQASPRPILRHDLSHPHTRNIRKSAYTRSRSDVLARQWTPGTRILQFRQKPTSLRNVSSPVKQSQVTESVRRSKPIEELVKRYGGTQTQESTERMKENEKDVSEPEPSFIKTKLREIFHKGKTASRKGVQFDLAFWSELAENFHGTLLNAKAQKNSRGSKRHRKSTEDSDGSHFHDD